MSQTDGAVLIELRGIDWGKAEEVQDRLEADGFEVILQLPPQVALYGLVQALRFDQFNIFAPETLAAELVAIGGGKATVRRYVAGDEFKVCQ